MFDDQLVAAAPDGGHVVPIVPVAQAALQDWRAGQTPGNARWAAAHGFTAGKGAVLVLPGEDGGMAGVVLGLGDQGLDVSDPWLWAGLRKTLPPGTYALPPDLTGAARDDALLGWLLQGYQFRRYLKDKKENRTHLLVPVGPERQAVENLVAAHYLVRDLVNTPANDLGPEELAAVAAEIAEEQDATLKIIRGDNLPQENFPAIYEVGKGSHRHPLLIDMTWGREDAPKVILVGKGVVFDTGGYNLKSGSTMELMKKDMGGAAHALALGQLVMQTGLDVRLRVLVPVAENSVSGNAFRPGDVIQTRKGLTIEIGNTDAEGRLILADALALGDEEAPDLMVDFATLTGAARVALGPDLPPFFTDDHKLADDLARLGAAASDPVWRLPLWQPYLTDLDSPIADLNNSGGRFAGAITAALFLQKFVEHTKSWVHLDVYAWNPKTRPGRPKGGEAMGLRTLFRLLCERFG